MHIRVLTLCVFRNGTRILVGRGTDDVTGEAFLRPLGGAVEFGERAVEALRREVREELGEEIRDPVRLGVLENLFEYAGEPGHEVVFVHDAAFANQELYASPEVPLLEPVWDGVARWIDLEQAPPLPLKPGGLIELLRGAT